MGEEVSKLSNKSVTYLDHVISINGQGFVVTLFTTGFTGGYSHFSPSG
jgi:hypothetical protein